MAEEFNINPCFQEANNYFEQQCAMPTLEEEIIKRAIQAVSIIIFHPSLVHPLVGSRR